MYKRKTRDRNRTCSSFKYLRLFQLYIAITVGIVSSRIYMVHQDVCTPFHSFSIGFDGLQHLVTKSLFLVLTSSLFTVDFNRARMSRFVKPFTLARVSVTEDSLNLLFYTSLQSFNIELFNPLELEFCLQE